jgi:UDP-GlcNAc:undecaprenyl-phosphate/decaprenyl-phosphate GlcNAc-1-phosphate transferase
VTFLSTLLLSIFITIGLIQVLQAFAVRMKLLDSPGVRKVHRQPIPRVGGIAMAVGVFVPVALWNLSDPFVRAYLAGAVVMVAFGIVDDSRGLAPKWKFLGQLSAALVVVFYGGVTIHTLGALLPEGTVLPEWVCVPLTVLAIVGVTNAINLADGLDGLAGGICLLIFACIGYLAWQEEDVVIGLIALALAGSIFGFLRFNTHPATVFMGDTGSQLLGFSAVTLSLGLTQGNTPLSPMVPLILLGLPVLDTVSVMAIRIAKRRSPFSADMNHIHHNLMALGLQQGESVVTIYILQMFLVASAFLFRFHSDWLLLGGYLVFSFATILFFMFANGNGWTRRPVEPPRDYFGSRFLRRMKTGGTAIRKLCPALEFGLPLLLVVTCLVPSGLPGYVSWCALAFFGLILAARFFWKERVSDLLRLTVYLTIPIVVYGGTIAPAGWMKGVPLRFYSTVFVLLALLDISVSKLSKRREGFKSTPLDFLIVVIAVLIPNLPEQGLQAYNLGLVAAKIIILYFSYEVLLAEIRMRYDRVMVGTLAALAVVFLKGVA